MPTTPPVPPAARTPYGPDGVAKDHADVTHRVRHAAERLERDDQPASPPRPDLDELAPLLKLAGATLAGYVLGALIHRRAAAPPPPPVRHPHRPRAAQPYRVQPVHERSNIRFR